MKILDNVNYNDANNWSFIYSIKIKHSHIVYNFTNYLGETMQILFIL